MISETSMMRRYLLTLWAIFLFHTSSYAQDFYDILKALPIKRPDSLTQIIDSRLYSASVNLILTDKNNNNNDFSNADSLQRLVLSSRGGTLAFPAGNRSAVEQFARAHANE